MKPSILLAFLIGALAAGAALAQDLLVPVIEPGARVEGGDPLTAGKALALAGLIAILVRVARAMIPQMADGTLFAKRATAGACLGLGLVFGLLGAAPVFEPGGLLGAAMGGVGAGGMAFLGAALMGAKARGEGE
jgi:hypothetical protein